jgi:hypothetical protein
LELWHEIGGSWQDFMNTPDQVIGEFREYLRAKSEGGSRKQKSSDNLAKLRAMRSKNNG